MSDKPQKTIGSVHSPFSLEINPEYVEWLEQQLTKANAEIEPSIPISQLQKLEAEWREEADRLLSKAGSIYMQALNSDNHQAAMSSRHYRNRADQLAELIHKNK